MTFEFIVAGTFKSELNNLFEIQMREPKYVLSFLNVHNEETVVSLSN